MACSSTSERRAGQVDTDVDDHALSFYVDDQPARCWDVDDSFIFNRYTEYVLGERSAAHEAKDDIRRCFNCGSPSHVLSSCTEPYNRELVSLSRQLFNFFKGGNTGESLRIHEVEEWRRQRIEWLEAFEPGHIRGPLLREALGLEGGDPGNYVEWLQNIALWGYPKGWAGPQDPRHEVLRSVVSGPADAQDTMTEEPTLFFIHGENDVPERLALHTSPAFAAEEPDDGDDTSTVDADHSATTPRRWAQYPETYFSSSRLPIYNGRSLPPVTTGLTEQSSTFSEDRRKLWDDIVNGRIPVNVSRAAPPSPPPPPPPDTPPPLPPEPTEPPPPLPKQQVDSHGAGDDSCEVDMVFSDSE